MSRDPLSTCLNCSSRGDTKLTACRRLRRYAAHTHTHTLLSIRYSANGTERNFIYPHNRRMTFPVFTKTHHDQQEYTRISYTVIWIVCTVFLYYLYCVLYCLYCVFVLFRLCTFILICFVCTSVRTTATE